MCFSRHAECSADNRYETFSVRVLKDLRIDNLLCEFFSPKFYTGHVECIFNKLEVNFELVARILLAQSPKKLELFKIKTFPKMLLGTPAR